LWRRHSVRSSAVRSPRLRLTKAAAEVAPGVTTFDTAGHTPGHISEHIGSGSEEMLLTGDVVVNSAVERHAEPIDQIDHLAAVLGADGRARGQRSRDHVCSG